MQAVIAMVVSSHSDQLKNCSSTTRQPRSLIATGYQKRSTGECLASVCALVVVAQCFVTVSGALGAIAATTLG